MPLDYETGLYYYGYRYYDPMTGNATPGCSGFAIAVALHAPEGAVLIWDSALGLLKILG